MQDDKQALKKLNEKINDAENYGDRDFLNSVLAPELAFQRANEQKTVNDRTAFLEKVEPGGRRILEEIVDIKLYGNRATVECIISVDGKRFHNLRLFVRRDGEWKLLGWANEPL